MLKLLFESSAEQDRNVPLRRCSGIASRNSSLANHNNDSVSLECKGRCYSPQRHRAHGDDTETWPFSLCSLCVLCVRGGERHFHSHSRLIGFTPTDACPLVVD